MFQKLLCCITPFTLSISCVFLTHASKLHGFDSCAANVFSNIVFVIQTGTEDYRSKLGGDCFADLACPEKCRCEGTTVDCSNQKLTKIPDHIPQYTAELWVFFFLISLQSCAVKEASLLKSFGLIHLFCVALRRLNNNEFTVLEATGIFKKLPHLRKM